MVVAENFPAPVYRRFPTTIRLVRMLSCFQGTVRFMRSLQPLIAITATISVCLLLSCGSKDASHISITISVPYEMDSFDPHATITVSNFAALSNFYEPLVRTDFDLKAQPCLARTWENPDGTTWIFHLQPDARFHSGKPLTADDVEYSLNRLAQDPQMHMRGQIPEISEVKAISKNVVRIKTPHAVTVFLSKLNFALIVPKGSTSKSLAENVNGTGPFKMSGWRKGDFLRLVRNDDYWGALPEVQNAVLKLSRNPEQAINDLMSGTSQMVQSNTKKLEQVVHSMNGVDLYNHSSLFVKMLGFDVWREVTPYCNVQPNPFMNPRVREAVNLALNRTELIYRLSTRAVAATQPIPAFIIGFNPRLPPPVYDPERARDLLKQAGYADGFKVVLHTRHLLRETADIVSDQLKQVGIQVEVNAMSDEAFFPAMNRHEPTFYLTRWGCPSGDASDILDDIFHSDDERIFGGNNFGKFSDPEIDSAIELSASIRSSAERQLLLQHIMQLLMQRLPMIPLYTDADAYALDHRFTWEPRNDGYILVSDIKLRNE